MNYLFAIIQTEDRNEFIQEVIYASFSIQCLRRVFNTYNSANNITIETFISSYITSDTKLTVNYPVIIGESFSQYGQVAFINPGYNMVCNININRLKKIIENYKINLNT